MGGFLTLLKDLPAIITFLLELKKLWDQFLSNNEKRENIQKLTEAMKNARETKDTSALTDLVNGIVTRKPL